MEVSRFRLHVVKELEKPKLALTLKNFDPEKTEKIKRALQKHARTEPINSGPNEDNPENMDTIILFRNGGTLKTFFGIVVRDKIDEYFSENKNAIKVEMENKIGEFRKVLREKRLTGGFTHEV